jgi:lipoyl(octanoyl) transferase
MLSLVAQRKADEIDDQLLLLEHAPVITLGRTADPKHLLVEPFQLEAQGIDLVQCGRGGEITYHGPGQLVAYAIMKLAEERRDLHRFLRDLEEVVILSLAALGVEASRVSGKTGVWISPFQKICSIGVRASSWVTSHGLALNLADTQSGFAHIRPCGLDGVEMVNLIDFLPSKPASVQELRATAERQLIVAMEKVFGCSANP